MAVSPRSEKGTRTLEDLRLHAKARLKALQIHNEQRYRQHPWPFISECIWTVDQVKALDTGPTPGSRIRKYPGEPDEPNPACDCSPEGCISYRHHLVNLWVRERIILVPKARRMMVSWTFLACLYWLARYQPNSFIGIVARKRGETDAEGSAELVKRISFMHDHLPERVKSLKKEYQFARLRLPDVSSEIVAIGQGANQLRQYTCTALLFDEFAFWEEAQATYAASFPTLEGGGRLAIVSSAGPGFFKQLCHDES